MKIIPENVWTILPYIPRHLQMKKLVAARGICSNERITACSSTIDTRVCPFRKKTEKVFKHSRTYVMVATIVNIRSKIHK